MTDVTQHTHTTSVPMNFDRVMSHQDETHLHRLQHTSVAGLDCGSNHGIILHLQLKGEISATNTVDEPVPNLEIAESSIWQTWGMDEEYHTSFHH